jgi:hypothetical protein
MTDAAPIPMIAVKTLRFISPPPLVCHRFTGGFFHHINGLTVLEARNAGRIYFQFPDFTAGASGTTSVPVLFRQCYAGWMTKHEPPAEEDLPALRPAVARYRRCRLRGYGQQSAQEMAWLRYRELRPHEDAHESRGKVMHAIRWAEAEFPEWMAGR